MFLKIRPSEDSDAYGREIWDYSRGRKTCEIIERDDGFIDISSGPKAYFAPFRYWPGIERKAIQYAKGRVLDVGCGAGRVGIYLQNKRRLDVLGIDNSPLAIKVSRKRGLRNTRLLAFEKINFKPSSFDSIVMFGNNFGLFGSKRRAKQLLKKLFVMSSLDAVLICESLDPYKTTDPDHLSYQAQNRARGRMSGQIRIRVRYLTLVGRWFDYLLVSQKEMKEIVRGTGWKIDRFIEERKRPLYIALISKTTILRR